MLLNPEFLESLNEEHVTIPDPPGAQDDDWGEDDGDQTGMSGPADPDDWAEEEEDEPEWVGEIEKGEGGLSEEDVDDLSEAFVDGVRLLKDLINDHFKSRFGRLIRSKFSDAQKRELWIVAYADTKGALTVDGVSQVLADMQKRSEKYKDVTFEGVMDVFLEYAEAKKHYTAKELREYQARGIQRNVGRVLRKYMDGVNADPLMMLGVYLTLAFAPDAVNYFFASEELRELKEAENARK